MHPHGAWNSREQTRVQTGAVSVCVVEERNKLRWVGPLVDNYDRGKGGIIANKPVL